MRGALLVSLSLAHVLNAQTTGAGASCCQKKVVSEPAEFAGEYNFKQDVGDSKDSNCFDGCIYTKDGGSDEYCFKQVSSGAATIDDQCDASPQPTSGGSTSPGGETSPGGSTSPGGETSPGGSTSPGGETSPGGSTSPGGETSPGGSAGTTMPGGSTSPGASEGSTTPGGSTSQGSTMDPVSQINAANQAIAAKNAEIGAATENQNAANSASAAVDSVNSALSTRRNRRQAASTTVGPVTGCTDFSTKYNALLDALAALSDDNIDTVKQLVTVLTAAVSDGVPCSTEEKTALQSSTSSKVTASKAAASTYAAAKATQIATLHAEVQAQQDLITAANNALVSSGQTTIAAATIAYTQAPTTGGASGGSTLTGGTIV